MPRAPPTPDSTPAPTSSPGPAPAGLALDRLRRDSGLSIDGEGRFHHRGEPITHARTLEVLWGSLQATPEGRWQVQVGRERADVAVDGTPWAVRGLRLEGDPPRALILLLCGGREAPLDPASLRLGPEGLLRCRLPGGEEARFTRAGQAALGEHLEAGPGGEPVLLIGAARHPVPAPG